MPPVREKKASGQTQKTLLLGDKIRQARHERKKDVKGKKQKKQGGRN